MSAAPAPAPVTPPAAPTPANPSTGAGPSLKKAAGPSHMPSITPFERPIPGQSWQHPPGTMPYDKPPQYSDPRRAMNKIFKNIMQPDVAMHFLAMMDSGLPVPVITMTVLNHASSEGMISVPMIPLMAPQLAYVLSKMAIAAGITPKTGKEDAPSPTTVTAATLVQLRNASVTQDQAQKAIAAGESAEKTAPRAGAKGLMAPPSVQGSKT